jgi:dUTP pyrophosphatase
MESLNGLAYRALHLLLTKGERPKTIDVPKMRPEDLQFTDGGMQTLAEALGVEEQRVDLHEKCGEACETRRAEDAEDGTSQRTLPWTFVDEFEQDGQTPTRGYADDAGIDLYVSDRTVIRPGEFVDVPSNVAIGLPPDTWALLQGRSSTLRKKRLLVNPGVIDPGYRGELYAGVQNLGDQTVIVEAGERIAQVILLPNRTREFNLQFRERLEDSERGTAGFGSTGQ